MIRNRSRFGSGFRVPGPDLSRNNPSPGPAAVIAMWHWQPNTMMIQRRAGGFRRVPTRSGRPPSRPLNWDNVRVTRALGLEACRVATRTATCCTGNQTPSGTRAQIVTRRGDPDFLSHTLARAGPGENRPAGRSWRRGRVAPAAAAEPWHTKRRHPLKINC